MAKRAKKKHGPKPKYLDFAYPNLKCKHHRKKALGNVVSNGTYHTGSTGKARLFLCRTCRKGFSTRSGTAFFDLRSPKKKVLMGLHLLFTSDFLPHYADILLELFGQWQKPEPTGSPRRPRKSQRLAPPDLRYARPHKEPQGVCVVKVTRSVIFGKRRSVEGQRVSLRRADGIEGQINTAYIERENLTLRQELGQLTRKALGFSKNHQELRHALDFIDAHDNFVRPHSALRLRGPLKRIAVGPVIPRRWPQE